jgi:hypothetical protein
VDITYHYADGSTSTFVLAQAQLPSLSSEYPLTNIAISVFNALVNVSPAGWFNAFVGAANALTTASAQSGEASAKSVGNAYWQITTQLLSAFLPEGAAVGTFYNWVTGHVSSDVLSPTAPTTVKDVAQTITCADVYSDPSGTVKSTTGVPLGRAKVTLLRSASETVKPQPVPNGSVVMSQANRRNPDHTNALGQYGWDVLPGFYEITASHPGCTATHGTSATSALLPVPPAQTGVNLALRCPHLRRSAVAFKLTIGRPKSRFGDYLLTAGLTARSHGARPQGTVSFYDNKQLLGAVSLSSRGAPATLPIPATTRATAGITARYSGDDAYLSAKAHARL